MSGFFVDKCEDSKKLNSMGRWYKPWFYKHVETFLESDSVDYEYIPTVDFFHRHNRSADSY
jgi:delta24-sterol reductase